MNLMISDDIYDYCEVLKIGVDTLIHESGPSQIEINLNHGGTSLQLADQAFLCLNEQSDKLLNMGYMLLSCQNHIRVTPGSSMHIHQNIISKKLIKIYLVMKMEIIRKSFFHFIGGLQTYLPDAMLFFRTICKFYRRFVIDASARLIHIGVLKIEQLHLEFLHQKVTCGELKTEYLEQILIHI